MLAKKLEKQKQIPKYGMPKQKSMFKFQAHALSSC